MAVVFPTKTALILGPPAGGTLQIEDCKETHISIIRL